MTVLAVILVGLEANNGLFIYPPLPQSTRTLFISIQPENDVFTEVFGGFEYARVLLHVTVNSVNFKGSELLGLCRFYISFGSDWRSHQSYCHGAGIPSVNLHHYLGKTTD